MNTQQDDEEEEFNKVLGFKIMMLRQEHKISQKHLGERIGVQYQQIQKYENGRNRISPQKLKRCAHVFGVPIEYFYDESKIEVIPHYSPSILNAAANIEDLPDDIRRSVCHLVRVINKLWRHRSNDNNPRT